ncbi:tryptophan synthase, alpha chain [secondary endosymbiont of Heteropsylla cubana]|uniref:Tryptophan synthase alpha chain n=1 Tax=secondary endosymbiont of Heteropsylla cubana TaxID=134287 RepID=J3YSU1_9ENTR|nr:tryptophan synthase subunit alpha [secondary endosymbiont of Heteropsylla cubana]AFP85373.1 tryptophan synthase, alpha chain [secondary endosymbiont of Heteropsylla cubana]
MERYQQLFDKLKERNEGAFVPFVTLGDPNFSVSLRIIETLIDAGADALEVGIPFSDPLADGPIIQNANLRAFSSGITKECCFKILQTIREKYPVIPIGLLMYANLIYNEGIETFYRRSAEIGIDSILVADVPFQESLPFRQAALRYRIAPIFICPPNADDTLMREIALHGRGYTYLLSRAGVTGSEKRANVPIKHIVETLKQYNAPPILQGFGISQTSQVRVALASGVTGVISGSAIVQVIEKYLDNLDIMLENLAQFVNKLKEATKSSLCKNKLII